MSGEPTGLAEQLDDVVLTLLRTATVDRAGLSLTAVSALGRLQRSGAARLTELAAAEGITQPSMTTLVGRLVTQGLVERAADPRDGRAVVLSLTPAGAELLARRRAVRTDRLTAPLAGLSPDDLRAIAAAMPALTRLADALRRPATALEAHR